MAKTNKKTLARKRRQYKVRKNVLGTADRPRKATPDWTVALLLFPLASPD